MIMGAMIMGPLGGFTIKKFDAIFQSKIKTGFEMLVNNFSAGLIGFALALVGFQAIGPVVDRLTQAMAAGVETILNAQLIPLTNIFIEPAKILFLNNAINHGILTPLGTEQVSETGRSILFLLEANPGPGLGVLLAFTLFGKGSAKSTAPGAMIIHFLGGIHEIYFPYVMMKPLLFLAVISGGVSGSFVFQLLGAGLRAPASPGSIIAILAMTPMGSYLPVILGVVAGAAASFAVAAVILKADSKEAVDTFEESVKATQAAKLSAKGLAGQTSLTGIQHIIFACDAGMGSSAMGASILRKKINAAGLPQDVTNRAINNLTDAANTLIVTQEELKNRAQQKAPNATFVAIENFLNSPKYDEIVATLSGTDLKETVVAKPAPVLDFDLANINEIVLVHDDRKGSATMGQKVVERILEREALNIPLRKVHINELEATPQTLVISKNSLTQAAKQKVPAAVHLSVDSLITTPKYESVVANLKQIA
jgi:PTS system mannitol-specific IIC component